jgi:hypothetical protein
MTASTIEVENLQKREGDVQAATGISFFVARRDAILCSPRS